MAAVAMRDQAAGAPAPLVLFIRSRAASARWLMGLTLTKAEHLAAPDREVDPVQRPGLAIDLDQAARLDRWGRGELDGRRERVDRVAHHEFSYLVRVLGCQRRHLSGAASWRNVASTRHRGSGS
jgi:hypothetical protein